MAKNAGVILASDHWYLNSGYGRYNNNNSLELMMRLNMNVVYSLVYSLLLAANCYADGINQPLPASKEIGTLLPSDQLAQIATNCRNEIIQAHQLKGQVPKEKQREYSITLGIAAEKCEAITKAFLELQKASQDYSVYSNNLQRAQSCAQGGFTANPVEPVYQDSTPGTPDPNVAMPASAEIQQETLAPTPYEQEPVPLH
jgi:hypothetical protein